jgi:hypothetical protein
MISDDYAFLAKVTQILAQAGWAKYDSPWALIDHWEFFIDQCKSGYSNNIYEYYNDMFSRKVIECIISARDILKDYEAFNNFSEKVRLLDAEFAALLQADVKLTGYSGWWEQGVLQYAGDELVKDYYNNYKIKVRVK